MNFNVEEIKARLDIPCLAQRLGLPLNGKNGIYHSPFRADRKPSFSISRDGKLFNDFATGEKGDVFKFYQIATGADFRTSLNALVRFAGLEKIAYKPFVKHREKPIEEPPLKPKIPPLFWIEAHARNLERKRGYSVEAQRMAYRRGVFGFCEYKGFPAWIITDGAGNTAQARRLDGGLWADTNTGHKAENLRNSNCSIPAGLEAIRDFKIVAICEGSSDFLASFHFAYINDCENDIAPLAILGATQDISLKALNALKDKLVIVFPDADEAGKKALKRWGDKIAPYAKKTFYFSFNNYHKSDGTPVKDLSDFMDLDADEWENGRPYTQNPYYELLERN